MHWRWEQASSRAGLCGACVNLFVRRCPLVAERLRDDGSGSPKVSGAGRRSFRGSMVLGGVLRLVLTAGESWQKCSAFAHGPGV